MFAQETFAEAIEHRLRRKWPKATVEYAGGGWFRFRSEPTNPPWKLRRKELKDKAAKIAEAH